MQAEKIDLRLLPNLLGNRPKDSYKNDYGHVLVIGGNNGMAGAPLLAAEAAARTGAGLVSVATRSNHVCCNVGNRPEIMFHGVESCKDISSVIKRISVIAIGPGLGQDEWSKSLFNASMQFDGPIVIDADALHLLGKDPHKQQNSILTPHPGEAAALLNISSNQVQSNRTQTAKIIQDKFGGICVLKGMGSLIAGKNALSKCTAGNPGMASGGMGDTLTGIIAGLCAQGLGLYDASRFGVQLHSEAADIAAQDGERGMLARDLLKPLRKLVG